MHAEDYVHRIGRTGRAGKSGRAFTIAAGKDDIKYIGAIEKLIGKSISPIELNQTSVVTSASDSSPVPDDPQTDKPKKKRKAKPIESSKKPTALNHKNRNRDGELPSPPDCQGSTMRETGHIPAFLTR